MNKHILMIVLLLLANSIAFAGAEAESNTGAISPTTGATTSAPVIKDFVRPGPDAFKNGQTTYAQVVQLMGEPLKTGNTKINGKDIKFINYAYANAKGEPSEEGIIPSRLLIFNFYNDTLVSQSFMSSFKSDSTDFDETRIGEIEKGKSTWAEVIKLLGNPPISGTAPIGEGIGYHYHTTRLGDKASSVITFDKLLIVIFDEKGLVSEVTYTVVPQNADLTKNLKVDIGKVDSSLEVKGDKLPLVTQLSGSTSGIPPALHTKSIYLELQDGPLLTAYLKNELSKKGYQFVDDKTQAAYVILGNGVYFSRMADAGFDAANHGQPRFGAPVGPLVEKSGGIDKIEVDKFPEYVGKLPSAPAKVDMGIVQSVAKYNISNGSSLSGGVGAGVGVAAGIEYLGRVTGVESAVNHGFLHLIGGGNLGLDDPACFAGCKKTQYLIENFVITDNGKAIDRFKCVTLLTGTKKHMPNEILAENMKNLLSLF
jgi:hypothetical protein